MPTPATKRTPRPAKPRRHKDPSAGRGAAARAYPNTSTNAGAALVPVDKPLTEMQLAFVRNWAAGDSILAASERAGYADGGTYAYRMVRMPNILALYEKEKAAYEEAAQMTRKKVMDGLLEAVEMAKLMAEPMTMIAGWREIGKMCGYYEPIRVKADITVNGAVVKERLEQLTDAELLELIQKGAQGGIEHDPGVAG